MQREEVLLSPLPPHPSPPISSFFKFLSLICDRYFLKSETLKVQSKPDWIISNAHLKNHGEFGYLRSKKSTTLIITNMAAMQPLKIIENNDFAHGENCNSQISCRHLKNYEIRT